MAAATTTEVVPAPRALARASQERRRAALHPQELDARGQGGTDHAHDGEEGGRLRRLPPLGRVDQHLAETGGHPESADVSCGDTGPQRLEDVVRVVDVDGTGDQLAPLLHLEPGRPVDHEGGGGELIGLEQTVGDVLGPGVGVVDDGSMEPEVAPPVRIGGGGRLEHAADPGQEQGWQGAFDPAQQGVVGDPHGELGPDAEPERVGGGGADGDLHDRHPVLGHFVGRPWRPSRHELDPVAEVGMEAQRHHDRGRGRLVRPPRGRRTGSCRSRTFRRRTGWRAGPAASRRARRRRRSPERSARPRR